MADLSLRALVPLELKGAAHLLSRGMRDNPVNVRAFGPQADRRRRAMARFFEPVVQGLHTRGRIVGAFRGSVLAGVCGMAPPGRCQPAFAEKLGILPAVVLGNGIGVPLRVLRWTGEWARRDPAQPHWHLGPVAVDPDLQGQKIGSAMLKDFCAQMDEGSALSYLETDKAENVRFYQRFGYTVVAEALVLGVRNWFMLRRP
jgi:ribosomal protein S18 acetylase RimI-like enzyme